MSKSYVKLKNVGDTATFEVVRCAPGTGTYPDVEFEDAEGRIYPMPKVSADRQLERLELSQSDIVGMTITISRGENKKAPDKPFWNLELASGAKVNGSGPASAGKAGASTSGGGVATPLSHQPPAPSPAPEKEKLNKVYGRCLDHVLTVELPKLKAAGVAVTHEGVSAMTSTLFIAAND